MYCNNCTKFAPYVSWEKKPEAPIALCKACSGEEEYDLMLTGWNPRILGENETGFFGALDAAEQAAKNSQFKIFTEVIDEVECVGTIDIFDINVSAPLARITLAKLSKQWNKGGSAVSIVFVHVDPLSDDFNLNTEPDEQFILVFNETIQKISMQFEVVSEDHAEALLAYLNNYIKTSMLT